MIKTINIQKLFGRFNYYIQTNPGGISIITGPNGFGKSTVLQIINALSKGNFAFFSKLDFEKLTVQYDNGKSTTVEKNNKGIKLDNIQTPFTEDFYTENIRYSQRRPWIQRVPDGFIDRRTDEFFSEDEYFYHVYFEDDKYFERLTKKPDYMDKLKARLDDIQDWCGEVRFISDQRLIRQKTKRADETQVIDVISELPKRLKSEISKVSEEYSRVANSLDSSYPKRLFATKDRIRDQEEYEQCLKEANEKFAKLNKYNLVDMSIIDEKNYNPTYSTALKIYFEDFAQKYTVFQDLISKLDLLTRIINNRLMFKHITISRDSGFEVVDNDNSDKKLQLSQLSSGEKQEIVLFYDLIFGTKEKLLLLIDEPEISLHIIWQKKFLDDLLEVSKHINMQVIVATHSPQIVSNHLDIQIDLGELYGAELNKNNLSKEDIIAEIRLTLSADFCHEKSIVIVEGEDDICFLNGKLLPHVDVYESYSGKQGVKEIVRAFSDDRVIGICDRDYDPCTSNSGIYYYDYCCLEMMLVSNDTVFSNFCYGYYRGSKDPLLLREELLQQLEELSLYRKLSAENDWGIKFSGISFGNAVDDNGRLDIEEMINQIKSINPCFSTSIQSQVERIKDEAGRHNTLSERLMITQGHDFMHCFHQVCLRKVQRKQKSPSVVEMYRSLVCAYRPSDFSHTDLFSEISDYQRSCKRSVLVPIESVAI